MARRRANGEGTIYRNQRRGCFEGQITVGLRPNGKPIRRKASGSSRIEVAKKLAEIRVRCSNGVGLPTDATVKQWLDYWVEFVLPGTSIARTTFESYRDLCNWYLIPELGRIQLTKLAPSDVRLMLAGMERRGYSRNTQRLAKAALGRALRVAEFEGHVSRNVAQLVDGVRLERDRGRTMTPKQVQALLNALKGERIEAVVHVMLATGLRRSEAWALSWVDLDLSSFPAKLRVTKALKRVRSGMELGSLKTKRTQRVIYLPEETALILKDWRCRQAAERLRLGSLWGEGWRDADFVFTTPTGTPLDPSNFRLEFGRVLRRAGIGHWTPHELRHTAASLMLSRGVSIKEVSEALGHSSIAITADVYGHLLEPSSATAEAMSHVMYGT